MAVRKAQQKVDVDELAIASARLEFEAGVDDQADILDLAAVPEPELWLDGADSGHTRGAYRKDAVGFMSFLGIRTPQQLARVGRGAVIAWKTAARERRLPGPDAKEIGRMVQGYVAAAGIRGRFSAHSMRVTFITRALENGASLDEVQRATGHADPSTTKVYDRRRFTPDRSAALFVSY